MVTEESGKKYQVDGGAVTVSPWKRHPRKTPFLPLKKHHFSLLTATSIFQEYVTEERLEVPVEFDEGINNLLKKIEVVTSLKFTL